MKNLFIHLVILLILASFSHAAKVKVESVSNADILLNKRDVICTIEFGANSSALSAEARQILAGSADRLKNLDLQKKMIRIEGFASPEGDRERNYKLSIERARAVERFLRTHHGVSLDHYITGFGPSLPEEVPAAGKRVVQVTVYDNPWGRADIPVEVTGGE